MKQLIKVRVTPEAKEEKLVTNPDGSYAVFVREEAQNGQANKRVKEILKTIFAKQEGTRVLLIKGGKSPSKIYEIISKVTPTKNSSR